MKFPKSKVVVVKILPAFSPDQPPYQAIQKINTEIDTLKFDSDPQVKVLDLWKDFTNEDGTLKVELYSDQRLHLNDSGYDVYLKKLKTLIEN